MREAEGVKIYFDPVSTAAREESARELAAKVLADPAKKDCINTVSAPFLSDIWAAAYSNIWKWLLFV